MPPNYRNWTLRGYMRPVVDWDVHGQRLPDGAEPVVVVIDPDKKRWEVTAKAGRITSITFMAESVDQRSLSTAPTAYLLEVATAYLYAVERAYGEDGLALDEAFREADRERGEIRLLGDALETHAFADAWNSTPDYRVRIGSAGDAPRVPRREQLAAMFGVSVYTIDKWTRNARDAGLIPPVAGKRRGRVKETPEGKSPSGNRKKETQ